MTKAREAKEGPPIRTYIKRTEEQQDALNEWVEWLYETGDIGEADIFLLFPDYTGHLQ